MLSKRREKELVTEIQRYFPGFTLDDLDEWDTQCRWKTYPELNFFANSFRQIEYCCGIYELGALQLYRLTPVEILLFHLWINLKRDISAIIATTASASATLLTADEAVLEEVGFVPVNRSQNGTGNHVTLWVFNVSPSTLHKVKEKKVASTKLSNSARARAK